MKALLSLLFLAGVVCLGLNVWNWVWMSSVDRERLVRAILADEVRGTKGVTTGSNPLVTRYYQVAYGRAYTLWGDRLLYGCGLVIGVVEGCWLRRRLVNKGYHLRLWISAQAAIVVVILGGLVLVSWPALLPYRMAAVGIAAVVAWFGFAASAGFPRTL